MTVVRSRARLVRALSVVATLMVAACSGDVERLAAPDAVPPSPSLAVIPSRGSATALDVATWNVEWFGDVNNGPADNALQASNVRDVLLGADQDIWGLQEIVDTTRFRQVLDGLPGYAAVVANDPRVVGGATYYNGFSNLEQKVGLVYKTSVATLLGAQVILGANDFEFAGRPPVEYRLRIALNGTTEDIVVIVLHAKAGADGASYDRRAAGAAALKTYIDTTWPTRKVFVIGDLNDDLDTSITTGRISSYANFVGDVTRYGTPTKALSDARISSMASYPDIVDHQIVTNEAAAALVAGSVTVYRVDQFITGYTTTTSDHFPVLVRYEVGVGTVPNQAPVAAFTVNCVGLTCTMQDGSTDADGTITARAWTFGNGTTSTVTNPTVSYAAAGTYAVTLTVTDNAGATASTSRSVTVSALPGRIIINEILANEPGSSTAGEAVELVNVGGTAVNIGGWTLSDGSGVRHTFAPNTVLDAGKGIAVYGGASAVPAGIRAVAASTGQLNLANSSDRVIVRQSSTIIDQFSYSSSLAGTDGVSMNRRPDLTAGAAFVLHSQVGTGSSSIGRRANGVVF